MTDAVRAGGQDFADAAEALGDDAIRAAIGDAGPRIDYPHGFASRPDGLYYDDGEGHPLRLCGPIEILAETRDARSAQWGLLLGWFDGDGREHRWAMPRAMLAGDGNEIRATLLDRGLSLAAGRKAQSKLIEFLAGVTTDARARAVDRVGWSDGAFALPDRTIAEARDRRVIFQGPAAFDHPYLVSGTLAEWKREVAALAIGNSRLAVAIAAGFVGPLLDLIGEEGGGLNYRGASSIGKSTALIAAASIWGQPSPYVRQWRATANGLEGVAVLHSETLLCLDELGQLDPKDAGIAAYLLANGSGKARAARSGSLRSPAQWRTFFLSSGEIGLADLAGRDGRGAGRSAAGQEIRILDIEADAGAGLGVFEKLQDMESAESLARRVKDAAGHSYGVAGPAFVVGVAAKRDTVPAFIRKGIEGFVSGHLPAGANGQAARAARRFGLIAMAGEIAARLGIVPWPAGEASTASATLFRAWLASRGGAGAVEDRDALERLRSFIALHGASRFEPIDRAPEMEGRTVNNRAGFWRIVRDDREYLIFREVWRAEVCAGMDQRRIDRLLIAKGILRADSEGGSTVPMSLPGMGKVRVYAVSASLFREEGDETQTIF